MIPPLPPPILTSQVSWLSGNKQGGYVRLSLVPEAIEKEAASYDVNVLKFTCFGDTDKNDSDCVHPCNARGGCEFQSKVDEYVSFIHLIIFFL